MLVELPAGTKAPISVPHAEQTAPTIFKGYRTCLVRVHILIYEHMQSDWSKTFNNPLRTGIVKQSAERFEKGCMLLPPGPGLGIELNDEVTNRYRVDRETT